MVQQRPPNVTSPAPVFVMPWNLCIRFESSSEFVTLRNEYPSGNSHRRALASTERRRWRVARRLTAADWSAFLAFYYQVKGSQSFYFYDPWDTVPRFHYDPTGTAQNGRYCVRFASALTMAAGLPRVEAELELVEVS
jgi:hypothetical protein